MDAFKGKYERTSAEQYDEFLKVSREDKPARLFIRLLFGYKTGAFAF